MADPHALELRDRFRRRFGGTGERVFFAPGRVNLIGEHVDYHGGAVLPVAVERGVFVAARIRQDSRVLVASEDCPETFDGDVSAIDSWSADSWCRYPLAALNATAEQGPLTRGVELLFSGDLPMGAGLASSAAVLVATALAMDRLHQRRQSAQELAELAHRAETQFVGVRCGIMDHYAVALGRAGHAVMVDCKNRQWEAVPWDVSGPEMVVFDSLDRRQLTDGRYNQRVAESHRAFVKLKMRLAHRTWLSEVTAEELEEQSESLSEVERRRARHVVTEVERVARTRAALARGEWQVVGDCLARSHQSLAEDYEVSTDRLDFLAEVAKSHAGAYGARLTGAGFGGCVLALADSDLAEALIHGVSDMFRGAYGDTPRVWRLGASAGPRELAEDHREDDPGRKAVS